MRFGGWNTSETVSALQMVDRKDTRLLGWV